MTGRLRRLRVALRSLQMALIEFAFLEASLEHSPGVGWSVPERLFVGYELFFP
jgi:hypothetical protein